MEDPLAIIRALGWLIVVLLLVAVLGVFIGIFLLTLHHLKRKNAYAQPVNILIATAVALAGVAFLLDINQWITR